MLFYMLQQYPNIKCTVINDINRDLKSIERLKADEQKQLAWSAKRELSKTNYRIHTDATKANQTLSDCYPTNEYP